MLFQYIVVYVASFIGLFASIFFLLTIFEHRHRIKNPVPTRFPLVSVIIPAYNEERCIRQTIESVMNLDYRGNLEIIVIDDGSKDRTYEIAQSLARRDGRIKVYAKKNGGKAAAINFAIARSKGEYIATLDADSFVERGTLMKMVGYLEDPRVAAVTPSLKVYQPRTFVQKIQKVEYLWGIFLRKAFAFMNALHVTPGPFSIFKREFFEKHGGFDENNPTEDTEIALRIQSHHYRIENSIDATVYTVSPKTFRVLLKQRIRWYYGLMKNLKLYPKIWDPKFGYIALFSMPAAVLSVVVILFLVSYFGFLFIDSLIDAFMKWQSVGFDFITMLKGFKWAYVYYDLTSPLTALLIILSVLNILFIVFAEIKSHEKNKFDIAFVYYFCVYSYFYAFWWAAAIACWLFGRISWGEISFSSGKQKIARFEPRR